MKHLVLLIKEKKSCLIHLSSLDILYQNCSLHINVFSDFQRDKKEQGEITVTQCFDVTLV